MNNSRITFESRTAVNTESQMSGMHFITRDIVTVWFDDAEHGGQARRQTHKNMTCVESGETRQVCYSNYEAITTAAAAANMADMIRDNYEITEVLQY
jgi:hypothetical protein